MAGPGIDQRAGGGTTERVTDGGPDPALVMERERIDDGEHAETFLDRPGGPDGTSAGVGDGLVGADLAPDPAIELDDALVDEETAGPPEGAETPDFGRGQNVEAEAPDVDNLETPGTLAGPGSGVAGDGLDPAGYLDEHVDALAGALGDDPSYLDLPTGTAPDDATHPGFDDPTATVGDDAEAGPPKGSYAWYTQNLAWDDKEGLQDKDQGGDPIATGALDHKIEAEATGAVDDDGRTVQQQWLDAANAITNDDSLSDEEKEEAMTELADHVQSVVSGSGQTGTGQTGSEAGGGQADQSAAPPPPEPEVTEDHDPEAVDPDDIHIDFDDPYWQIQTSADANDDIQYADHPGSEPIDGGGLHYDGVDYGGELAAPADLPPDAVDSVYDDPAIDPVDDL